MTIRAWAATDVGRKRVSNEDACLVDAELGLHVVADGMGGHAAGEVASKTCVDAIRAQVSEERNLLTALAADPSLEAAERAQAMLERAVHRACREIYALAEEDSERHGMGTTCVVLLAAGRKALIGHVGDSRVYLHRNGTTYQLTEDHSLIEEHVKHGRMTRAEAENSDIRNVITRAVGVQPSVEVDTLVVDLLPGDLFLLCSDGLHGHLKDAELGPILDAENKPGAPERLIDLANERGGRDNITAVLVSYSDEAPARDAIGADQKVEILRGIRLFRYMTYKELLAILSVARMQHYEASETIVTEGEKSGDLFAIIRGAVEVRRGNVSVARLTGGGHFGEMALVDRAPRSASVVAAEATSVMAIGRDALLKLMRRESLMAVKLLWAMSLVLSERLRHTTETMAALQDQVERLRSTGEPEAPPAPFGDGT